MQGSHQITITKLCYTVDLIFVIFSCCLVDSIISNFCAFVVYVDFTEHTILLVASNNKQSDK